MAPPSWNKEALLRRASEQADETGNPALWECLRDALSSQNLDRHHVLSSHYDILVFRDVTAIHKSGAPYIELRLTSHGQVEVSVNYARYRDEHVSSSFHLQMRSVGTAETSLNYLMECIRELDNTDWSHQALRKILANTVVPSLRSAKNTSGS